jgi:lipopolysaccharide transport system ATP-binding protein
MYVRLAFAVAAHLEPEILIVDEVLAVGDASFQKKCLGKMGDVAKEGRTVLFVSHNMAAVKALCTRAMLLDGGRITHDGNVDYVVETYLMERSEIARTGIIPDEAPRLYGTGEAKLRSVEITDDTGEPITQLYLGQSFRINVTFDVLERIPEAIIEISIATADGTQVTLSATDDEGGPPLPFEPGRYQVSLELDVTLLPRHYTLILGLHRYADGTTIDWFERSLDFSVLGVAEVGADSYRWSPVRGYVRPSARWSAPKLINESAIDQETIQETIVSVNEGVPLKIS